MHKLQIQNRAREREGEIEDFHSDFHFITGGNYLRKILQIRNFYMDILCIFSVGFHFSRNANQNDIKMFEAKNERKC